MSSITQIGARELDHRSGDGIDVTLFWSPRTNRLWIVVEDTRDGDSIEFDVDPADALDAFNHPYAYADTDTDYALAA